MNHASIDVDALRTFREELRGRRVALRSFIDRDDIDDVEIVAAEDPEVSPTRQVLKVEAVERTGEIDALDVLESIDIVQACAPSEVIAVTATAPLPAVREVQERAIEERAPYAALDVEDDAFFAHADPPSTGPVTFHLGDCFVDEIGPTIELQGAPPVDRRQRLVWIVGTVLACAVVMTAAAAITEQTQTPSGSTEPTTTSAAAKAPTPAATTPSTTALGPTVALTPIAPATTTAYPAIPEMDVRSLPAALAGTIVGVAKRPLFVDGKRLQSSTAIVACGKHMVRSGTFRAARLVDVPCGGSIVLK